MKMPPCDHDECGVTACKQMKIDPNDQAFPCLESPEYHPIAGLTIRAHFASLAMQAMCCGYSSAHCAEEAVKYADALITQLNK